MRCNTIFLHLLCVLVMLFATLTIGLGAVDVGRNHIDGYIDDNDV